MSEIESEAMKPTPLSKEQLLNADKGAEMLQKHIQKAKKPEKKKPQSLEDVALELELI